MIELKKNPLDLDLTWFEYCLNVCSLNEIFWTAVRCKKIEAVFAVMTFRDKDNMLDQITKGKYVYSDNEPMKLGLSATFIKIKD